MKSTAEAQTRTSKKTWWMCWFLFLGTALIYLDRTIAVNRDLIVAVAELAHHLYGAELVRVVGGVLPVPKLRRALIAGEFAGNGINLLFLLMEISPLSARHLPRRDGQRPATWLANKEYHEIQPRRCLTIGHVEALASNFPFFNLQTCGLEKRSSSASSVLTARFSAILATNLSFQLT